jgi:hypothetical protein
VPHRRPYQLGRAEAGADGVLIADDTLAQATLAFTDMGFNLGALAGTGTATLGIDLSVTSDAASSGFYGGVIVGDPPPREVIGASHTQRG